MNRTMKRMGQGMMMVSLGLAAAGCGVEEETAAAPTLAQAEAKLSPGQDTAWFRAENDTLDTHGILQGASWVNTASYAPGIEGQAFDINHSTGYVQIPDAPFLNGGSFSIEADVLPLNRTVWHTLLSKQEGNSQFDYGLWMEPGAVGHVLKAHVRNTQGAGVWLQSSIYPMPMFEWNKVRISYEAHTGKFQLWHNNVLQAENVLAGVRNTSNTPLRLGDNGYGDRFLGRIDQVKIWNSAHRGTNVPLSNPSFESSSLTGWSVWSNTGSDARFTTGTSNPVPQTVAGARYAQVDALSGAATAILSQNFGPVTGGQRYRVGVWMRSHLTNSTAEVEIRNPVGPVSWNQKKSVTITPDWQRVDYDMVVPAGYSGSAQLLLRLVGTGYLRADGVTLTRLD